MSARPDVLTFETEPLDEDVAVVGPIEIELWVSTDAPDTDFTAKLIDVGIGYFCSRADPQVTTTGVSCAAVSVVATSSMTRCPAMSVLMSTGLSPNFNGAVRATGLPSA